MDGRAPSYVPGTVPVNQEPLYNAVGKKLLEKVYEVHRKRVVNAEPMVDARLKVFDFLTDQSWKMLAKRHQELELMKHNEIIYGRISKVQNQESNYTKERREHVKNIEHQSKHSKRLKEVGRMRAAMKIQRENEHMHHRIQRARPYYSVQRFRAEYKHVQLFKSAKRADYTAGHLLNIKKKFAPKVSKVGEESKLDQALNEMKSKASRSRKGNNSMSMSASQSILTPLPSLARSVDSNNKNYEFKPTSSLTSMPDRLRAVTNKSTSYASEGSKKKTGKKSKKKAEAKLSRQASGEYDDEEFEAENGVVISRSNSWDSRSTTASVVEWKSVAEQLFAIPFDTKNCAVQVCLSKQNTENVLLRVIAVESNKDVMCERMLSLDEVHAHLDQGISNLTRKNNGPVHTTTKSEDSHALRSMLINMFREADKDQKGYLTYEEFHTLMQGNELGITKQELKFVVSEADENDDGLIAYNEFVPLAVDMILAFRARAHAKFSMGSTQDNIEDDVLKILSSEELEGIATICADKIIEKDFDKSGALPPNVLKRALEEVMGCGLSSSEVHMIVKQLNRDESGRCILDNFKAVLYDVRFLTIKNTMTEAQGTDITKYLLDLCKEEEKRVQETTEGPHASGHLTLRSLIDVMLGSPRLSLSRLQVMVIASEATMDSDGLIDYHAFIPMAARVIEQMYDPAALKQRANLIAQSEVGGGGGSLVNGVEPEVFQRRLLTLFKSYDTDRSGSLDSREFKACMDSMDLHLTPSEVLALMTAADTDGSGHVDLDEFTEFCTHNLMHLEREKHIRSLQNSMKKQSEEVANKSGEEREKKLRELFELADQDGSGFLNVEELEAVFKSLDVSLSAFQMQVLLSEADGNGDGVIAYEEFLPIAMDLIQVLKVNDSAQELRNDREEAAMKKAEELTAASQHEIHSAAHYIRKRFRELEESPEHMEPDVKLQMVKNILCEPKAGLSRTEVPHVLKCAIKTESRPNTQSVSENALNQGSQSSSGAVKPFSLDFTNLELGIFETRKLSIMFGLLENSNKGTLEKHLQGQLENEAKRIQEDEGLPEVPIYIPVRNCFEVLESSTSLRCHRTQLVAIISWADCFDEEGANVDYRRFARYAADMMSGMLTGDDINRRQKIKNDMKISDQEIMKGLTEPELTKYLSEEAEKYHKRLHGHGHATMQEGILPKHLQAIVINIPLVSLSPSEASTIIAQIPISGGMVHWGDFIPSAYANILTVCRERMISRRAEISDVHVEGQKESKEKKEERKAAAARLGTRLLQIIKLKNQTSKKGQTVAIILPDERPSSMQTEDMGEDEAAEMNQQIGMSGKQAELCRKTCMIPVFEINDRHHTKEFRRHMPLFLRIMENDIYTYPDKCALELSAISVDGSISVNTDVPVRMPTAGLVDAEVALSIAHNILDSIYLIQDSNRNCVIKFKDM